MSDYPPQVAAQKAAQASDDAKLASSFAKLNTANFPATVAARIAAQQAALNK